MSQQNNTSDITSTLDLGSTSLIKFYQGKTQYFSKRWKKYFSGGIIVILDMFLALISIVANLMVITSIREKESLMTKTFNLVLVNICCSNLLSAVLVKSITIVHHAYAVTANVTQTDVAFCLLYKFSSRLAWAVLPWTVVVLTWLTLTPTDMKKF